MYIKRFYIWGTFLKVKIFTDPYIIKAEFSASFDGANSEGNQSYYEFSLAFKIKIFKVCLNIYILFYIYTLLYIITYSSYSSYVYQHLYIIFFIYVSVLCIYGYTYKSSKYILCTYVHIELIILLSTDNIWWANGFEDPLITAENIHP